MKFVESITLSVTQMESSTSWISHEDENNNAINQNLSRNLLSKLNGSPEPLFNGIDVWEIEKELVELI